MLCVTHYLRAHTALADSLDLVTVCEHHSREEEVFTGWECKLFSQMPFFQPRKPIHIQNTAFIEKHELGQINNELIYIKIMDKYCGNAGYMDNNNVH